MILGNLKYDRNIHTEIEDICTILLINILALGDERITAASPLKKDYIFASGLSETLYKKEKQYAKSEVQKNILKHFT